METERRNTERLRREREQKEQAEHLKQVEEHRKQREKELADRQVGGGIVRSWKASLHEVDSWICKPIKGVWEQSKKNPTSHWKKGR